MEKFFHPLQRTPGVEIYFTFVRSAQQQSKPSNTLLVFLNGIDCPQTFWYPVMKHTQAIRSSANQNLVPMLSYDRPGQGKTTGRNPDQPGRLKRHGHDSVDAAYDLREIITMVATSRLGIRVADLRIVIAAHSISCAIARIYAALHPSNITGLILLDLTLSNSDTISVFPDPSSPSFDQSDLPEGIAPEMCHQSREKIRLLYHPDSPNREGLWRGNLPLLLSRTDEPKIIGPSKNTPYITVIGHDPEEIARQTKRDMGFNPDMIKRYLSSFWQEYNEELVKLTAKELAKGPVIAKGAGHLIIRDDPKMVAVEIVEVLDKLSQSEASRI